jgi:hypothetical protein
LSDDVLTAIEGSLPDQCNAPGVPATRGCFEVRKFHASEISALLEDNETAVRDTCFNCFLLKEGGDEVVYPSMIKAGADSFFKICDQIGKSLLLIGDFSSTKKSILLY